MFFFFPVHREAKRGNVFILHRFQANSTQILINDFWKGNSLQMESDLLFRNPHLNQLICSVFGSQGKANNYWEGVIYRSQNEPCGVTCGVTSIELRYWKIFLFPGGPCHISVLVTLFAGGFGRGIWCQVGWGEWAARYRSLWRGWGGGRVPFCWPDPLNQGLKGSWSSTSLSQLQRRRVQANLIVSLCQPK